MSTKNLVLIIGGVAMVVMVACWAFRGPPVAAPMNEPTQAAGPVAIPSTAPGSAPILSPRLVGPGAGTAPVPLARSTTTAPPSSTAPSPVDTIGVVQPVRADANAQVAAVAAALKNHDHPERLSLMAAAKPFDPAAFKHDPQAYVNDPQPGRAFQSAAPGEGVPVLTPLTSTQVVMRQDGQTILRVRTQPLMPATFTSTDLGRFSNQLTTQTVIADERGVASVAFSAGTGTIDGVHILASSPAASGQINFYVTVQAAAGKRPGNG